MNEKKREQQNQKKSNDKFGSSAYIRIMMENLCRVYYNDCKCF